MKHGKCHHLCLKKAHWKNHPWDLTPTVSLERLTSDYTFAHHQILSSLARKYPETQLGWKTSWCQTVSVWHCNWTRQRKKKHLAHPNDGAGQASKSPVTVSLLRDLKPTGNIKHNVPLPVSPALSPYTHCRVCDLHEGSKDKAHPRIRSREGQNTDISATEPQQLSSPRSWNSD